MPLHLLPTDQDDDSLLARVCALQVARNRLDVGVRSADQTAIALIVVIDELIEQLRERSAR